MRGHAIEARICAENPDSNFLPATGTLQVMRWPEHVSFERDEVLPRVDTGFGEGDAVSPYYDSMIAKLIVWGETARRRWRGWTRRCATRTSWACTTTWPSCAAWWPATAFATADLDTALIERERAVLFGQPPLAPELAAAGVVARRAGRRGAAQEGADPWSRRDGWRLHGGARRRLDLDLQGQPLVVVMQRLHDGATTLQIGDQRWPPADAHWATTARRAAGRAPPRADGLPARQPLQRLRAQGSALLTQADPLAQAPANMPAKPAG
jgi:3-methylcrotonyl-CoA carboxylase alpha subunit